MSQQGQQAPSDPPPNLPPPNENNIKDENIAKALKMLEAKLDHLTTTTNEKHDKIDRIDRQIEFISISSQQQQNTLNEVKNSTIEAVEKAKDAEKLAQIAFNTANNAMSLANDTSLKTNNIEKRLKTLETSQSDTATQIDQINNDNNNVIKSLQDEAANSNKALADHTDRIEDIANTLETIVRNKGQQMSQDISHNIPDEAQIVITQAELLRRALNPHDDQEVLQPSEKLRKHPKKISNQQQP